MTEQEKQAMQDAIRQYFQGFPESPASDNFDWVDKDGFVHKTTLREWSLSALMEKVGQLSKIIMDRGGRPVKDFGRPAAPPKQDPAAKAAAEAGNPQLAGQLQAQAEGVPALDPNGHPWNTTDAVFIKVLPQPDDKVNLEFYGNSKKQPYDKFPSVKITGRKVADMQALMKHVTSEDLSRPQNLQLHCRLYWKEGREYTKEDGTPGHYKDVEHIRPLG